MKPIFSSKAVAKPPLDMFVGIALEAMKAMRDNKPGEALQKINEIPYGHAALNIQDEQGWTLLGEAITRIAMDKAHPGDVTYRQIATVLIGKNTDVNGGGRVDRAKPLDFAIQGGHVDIIEMLVKRGARYVDGTSKATLDMRPDLKAMVPSLEPANDPNGPGPIPTPRAA